MGLWVDIYNDELIFFNPIVFGDKMTLGMPFFQQYYSIYDLTRNQMAIVPSIYADTDLDPPFII